MSEEQKRKLETQLWAVANTLRGRMHADEYRNYILGFIFYKYLSERLAAYVNQELLASEDFTFSQIDEQTSEGKSILEEVRKGALEHLGFFLKPNQLFAHIVRQGRGEMSGASDFILGDLRQVLNTIEQTSSGTESEDDFKGLFSDVDLGSNKLGNSEKEKNEVIVEVLSHLSEIDFKLEDAKSDLLGDAYEYLISKFAAGAGRSAGEFYTPAQVSRLLSRIVTAGKQRIRTVYDPTCGSGSLLLRVSEYADVVDYYGQELNPTTHNLARMNMILHGVHFAHFEIRRGDTLTNDLHPDLKAEVIVANPPFSAKWKGEKDPVLAQDDRFVQYGRLAPSTKADYAFVTHMLYHLADNGAMAVVLPHGVLFRGAAEGQIRKYIVEKLNYLDAVIGLPANVFYGTSIPATVCVFKKCRKSDDDILFIDASREFEKGTNQNNLLDKHIDKIFDTYINRKEVEKYSHRAMLKEIKENDYNLNIPRYVDTFEEEEPIDINVVAAELKNLQFKEIDIQKQLAAFCKELGIEQPF